MNSLQNHDRFQVISLHLPMKIL